MDSMWCRRAAEIFASPHNCGSSQGSLQLAAGWRFIFFSVLNELTGWKKTGWKVANCKWMCTVWKLVLRKLPFSQGVRKGWGVVYVALSHCFGPVSWAVLSIAHWMFSESLLPWRTWIINESAGGKDSHEPLQMQELWESPVHKTSSGARRRFATGVDTSCKWEVLLLDCKCGFVQMCGAVGIKRLSDSYCSNWFCVEEVACSLCVWPFVLNDRKFRKINIKDSRYCKKDESNLCLVDKSVFIHALKNRFHPSHKKKQHANFACSVLCRDNIVDFGKPTVHTHTHPHSLVLLFAYVRK